MVKIKIGEKKDTEQPILSLNMAKLKMTQVEWQGEPQEVSRKEGRGTFVSPPHLNALIEVVDDYGDGSADGEKFWEKFRLSRVDGVDDELSSDAWEGRPGTKFAACMESRYGPKFWANGGEFEPKEFEGWEFNAGVMPRTPPGGGSPVGSQVDYKSMHAIPKPKKKKKQPKKEESGQAGDDLDFTDEELDQMEEALG